jgi:hypothetical protein
MKTVVTAKTASLLGEKSLMKILPLEVLDSSFPSRCLFQWFFVPNRANVGEQGCGLSESPGYSNHWAGKSVADKEPQDITDVNTPRNFFHHFSSFRSISNRKMRR